uniref:Uncharacterized protein n=1 Tax=Chromera velia CCMP2878 TaxID=1169474 RepID=A0A0G4GN16_9ALVE|eukprot:Cvel_22617.t1-p1 / transcript=Cvel_22617.t1 / gene=Cvel_22617 / organism=Chromera_velia_CCMP2878 / gene_product=hypothetical protein / transcript_product=hypothetical protein / location=Cvel_scaffold2240:7904-8821(-) / protein_length=70 / sequence_SO=supercontig / SO=protein_coding / is_pseudo=false
MTHASVHLSSDVCASCSYHCENLVPEECAQKKSLIEADTAAFLGVPLEESRGLLLESLRQRLKKDRGGLK